jgi:putative sigma-54 modulation protein
VDVTPPLRQLVNRRLARLERLLNDSAVSAQVVLTLEKREHRAEVTVHARGDHMLTGMGSATSWPLAIGEAVEKVTQQGIKVKDKWRTRKRRSPRGRALAEGQSADGESGAPGDAEPERHEPGPPALSIVRMTRYAVKPMRIEDAALRIRDAREPFIVFRQAETERLAILFERSDGRLGLIDPDN